MTQHNYAEDMKQPFDPGYDYAADRPIEERMMNVDLLYLLQSGKALELFDLLREGAGEIRALRLLVKHQSRRIDDLRRELEEQEEPR